MYTFLLLDHIAIDCTWENWTEGACSVTCGVGIRIDTREKSTIESNGGRCEGCETKIEECSKENCPGRLFKIISIMKNHQKLTIFTKRSYRIFYFYVQLIAIGQSGLTVNVPNHVEEEF